MEEQKAIKAKSASLIGQIFSAVWITVWCTYKFIRSAEIQVTDVLYSGIGIAACFSPVYFSIVLDKIKDIRFGDKS